MFFLQCLLLLFWFWNFFYWVSTKFALANGMTEYNPFYYTFLEGNIYYFLIFKIWIGLLVSLSLILMASFIETEEEGFNKTIAWTFIYFFLIFFVTLFFYLGFHNFSLIW